MHPKLILEAHHFDPSKFEARKQRNIKLGILRVLA